MNPIDIIIKAITLLHRENELEYSQADRSIDLAKTVLDVIEKETNMKGYHGGTSDILTNLINLLKNMIHNPDNYDKSSLMQSLELIASDNVSILKVIEKAIDTDMNQPSLKRTVVSLRNNLNNFYKEKNILNMLTEANSKLRSGNTGGISIRDYVMNLIINLDALLSTSKQKDPGIVNEIDINDEENLSAMVSSVQNQSSGTGKLKTGWKALNTMLQGGFRKTETVVLEALQHRYKSGFTKSVFMQLGLHNVPVMKDPSKKPLLSFISFEDDIDITIDFMYKYLYFNEHKVLPDMSVLTSKEIAQYIKKRLSVNGYHIKIIRVNPSEWTYRHLFNYILELEADGYEIHACFVDYLSKLPTTGCISGPAGTDIRDLWNRCRNFFSA